MKMNQQKHSETSQNKADVFLLELKMNDSVFPKRFPLIFISYHMQGIFSGVKNRNAVIGHLNFVSHLQSN